MTPKTTEIECSMILRRLDKAPLGSTNDFPDIWREIISHRGEGIGSNSQDCEINIRKAMRESMTPRADTAAIERVCALGCDHD